MRDLCLRFKNVLNYVSCKLGEHHFHAFVQRTKVVCFRPTTGIFSPGAGKYEVTEEASFYIHTKAIFQGIYAFVIVIHWNIEYGLI